MGKWAGYSGYGRYPPPPPETEPPEERYFGLTAAQFNLALLLVVGAIGVAAFLLLGGPGALREFLGEDERAPARTGSLPAPTAVAVTPTPVVAAAEPAEEGRGDTVGAILGSLDPLSVVSGNIGGGAAAPESEGLREKADVLRASLLDERNLPAGFFLFSDFAYYIPTAAGTCQSVAAMFANGDLINGDPGSIVLSAAFSPPGGAAGELDDVPDQAELDELAAVMEESGVTVRDFRLLGASGLGDAAVGFHVEMDFGGLLQTLDPSHSPHAPDSLAWDMYLFARGDFMYMVMEVRPAERAEIVDAYALALIMDAKARRLDAAPIA